MIMSIISEMDFLEHNNLNCPSERRRERNWAALSLSCSFSLSLSGARTVHHGLQYYFVNELALACSERRGAPGRGGAGENLTLNHFSSRSAAIVALLTHGRGGEKRSYYPSSSLFSPFIV